MRPVYYGQPGFEEHQRAGSLSHPGGVLELPQLHESESRVEGAGACRSPSRLGASWTCRGAIGIFRDVQACTAMGAGRDAAHGH